MKFNIFCIGMIFCFLSLNSCKDNAPNPSDLVGFYTVSGNLTNTAVDEEGIKASVEEAMEEAKQELHKAKEEMQSEFDTSNIDTSTVEGKIEKAAKEFSRSMSDFGTAIGDMGIDLGTVIGDATTDGINLGESILKSLKLDIELQADGDLKVKNALINLGFHDAKWHVSKDHFIVTTDKKETPDTFAIKNRSNDGFTLSKEEIEFIFKKKEVK